MLQPNTDPAHKNIFKAKRLFCKHQGFAGNHPSWSHEAVSGSRPALGRLPDLSTVGLAEDPKLACNPTCSSKPSRPGSSSLWGSSDLRHFSPHPGLAWECFIHSRSFHREAALAPRTHYTNLNERLVQVVGRLLRSIPNVVTSGVFNGFQGSLSSRYT